MDKIYPIHLHLSKVLDLRVECVLIQFSKSAVYYTRANIHTNPLDCHFATFCMASEALQSTVLAISLCENLLLY